MITNQSANPVSVYRMRWLNIARIWVWRCFGFLGLACLIHSMYKLSPVEKIRVRLMQAKAPTPKFNFTVAGAQAEGYVLLAPFSRTDLAHGQLVVMDLKGNIALQRNITGAVTTFRQWNFNGKTMYSYLVNDTAVYHSKGILAAGHAVLLDSAFNEVKQIHKPGFEQGSNAGKKVDLAIYDVLFISPEHYITMSFCEKEVTNIPVCLAPAKHARIIAPIIQEIKDDRVVWQWDATDYPEFYLNSERGNRFYDTSSTQDYLHINAMIIDPHDSNIIISSHNSHQLIKIERGTGKTLWRLGGRGSDFALSIEQVFRLQHNVTVGDTAGTLLVFDNGEKYQRNYSRVLEFRLDEQNKTIKGFRSYKIEAPHTEFMGSVQKIGRSYFICGGSANYVQQVDISTGRKMFELKSDQSFFRAYYIDKAPGLQKAL